MAHPGTNSTADAATLVTAPPSGTQVPLGFWPVCIVEDRYGGAYSGGSWLAIADGRASDNGAYRVVRTLEEGPHGGDCEAMEFWLAPPAWIAVGNTPDEALAALLVRQATGAAQ